MIERIFAAPALGPRARNVLIGLVFAGLCVRLVWAFSTRGVPFDISSYELVRDALATSPGQVYSEVNAPNAPHWPYPPGFFLWILISRAAHDLTGLRFDGWIQVAPILADAALAFVVQRFLGQRGASDRTRVVAGGLVAFGPTFLLVSGYHGQLDAVSILPATVALWAWIRLDGPQRAVVAGLLAGIGGGVKIPAIIVVLALLPTARSVREGVTLLAAAAVVPLALFAPWLLADPDGTVAAIRMNDGLPGVGGLSLLVQPELSGLWLRTSEVELSAATLRLMDFSAAIAIASLLVTGGLLLWRRTPALPAAVLLFVAVYAFGVNFSPTYLIWGVPFFLMAGYVRHVAALEAVILVPMALLYWNGARDAPLHWIYTPILLALLVCFVAAYLRLVRDVVAGPPAPSSPPAPEPARATAG